MATRFYLSSTATSPVSPSFKGAWGRTTEADRRLMSPTADGSALTNKTIWANGTVAANTSALARQYISAPMSPGIAFDTSDTIKAVIRCMESATNDNINRTPIGVYVVSEDGATLRATLKALGAYGPNTTEWNTSLRSKRLADGDALSANYTTVLGDRLVIEVGGQVDGTGGTSVTGTMSFGSAAGADLTEDETTTTANNPWFEISRDITFVTLPVLLVDLMDGGVSRKTWVVYPGATVAQADLTLTSGEAATVTNPRAVNLRFTHYGTLARSRVSYAKVAMPEVVPGITAAIAGTFTVSGALSATVDAKGSIAGTFVPAGAVSGQVSVAGSISGSFAPGGAVAAEVGVSAAVAGTFAPAGAIEGVVGTPVDGAITGTVTFSGSVSAAVSVDAVVAGIFDPVGAVAGTTAVSGSIAGSFAPTGSISGQAERTGSIAGVFEPSGHIDGTVDVRGGIDAVFAPAGAVTGEVEVSGDVAGSFAPVGAVLGFVGEPPRLGTIEGVFAPIGAITADVGITGAVSGTFTVGGSISGAVEVRTAIAGTVTFTGAINTLVAAQGAIAGTWSPVGEVAAAVPVSASVAGLFAPVGTVAARVEVAGQIVGIVAFEGSIAGAVTDLPDNTVTTILARRTRVRLLSSAHQVVVAARGHRATVLSLPHTVEVHE